MSLIFFGSTISIHAPSRERPNQQLHRQERQHFNPRSLTGATLQILELPVQYFISIHAPSRERLVSPTFALVGSPFQSTLPNGSDQVIAVIMLPAWLISIHAPSRERRLSPAKVRRCAVFNPRSLTGATGAPPAQPFDVVFQSTLPHGSDWFRRPLRWSDRHFNPRSLTGATKFDAHQPATVVFSIHAPSRERLCPKIKETPPLCFQSTLPHGSDIPPATAPAADPIFNPRIEEELRFRRFQSTLPRGSDLHTCLPFYWLRNFNPRSLAGATKNLGLSDDGLP